MTPIETILANAADRVRLFFVERDGETFVGYVPRQRRGAASRAERNRMRRFAHHVWHVRRLPFKIRCVDRNPGAGWTASNPAYLPMPAWAEAE